MQVEKERLKQATPIATLGALLLGVVLGVGSVVAAQDVTPTAGGTRAISCDSVATETMATPSSEEAPLVASPAAELVGTPASGEPSAAMTRTVRTLADCLNSGDYAGAAALMTDNFIQTVLGATGADEVLELLAGTARMRIRLLSTPEMYDDGTASVIVTYDGFVNTTGAPIAERWYFVVVGDIYKIDRAEPADLPAGIS